MSLRTFFNSRSYIGLSKICTKYISGEWINIINLLYVEPNPMLIMYMNHMFQATTTNKVTCPHDVLELLKPFLKLEDRIIIYYKL